jgi:hypothetical protein
MHDRMSVTPCAIASFYLLIAAMARKISL